MKMSKSESFETIYEQNKYFNKLYESNNKKDDDKTSDVSYKEWERLYKKYEILTNKYLTEINDKIEMLRHILYFKSYFTDRLTDNKE